MKFLPEDVAQLVLVRETKTLQASHWVALLSRRKTELHGPHDVDQPVEQGICNTKRQWFPENFTTMMGFITCVK
jgi:hypothetical protein